ncbi:TonB-dependent receptor [Povalibacter sp.]|uniref:TonB-dependent receptor plug domain-containing protein n=1 Tax=Povalibacter sp. TaxID=1962978 RepID=UPI002F3FD3C2
MSTNTLLLRRAIHCALLACVGVTGGPQAFAQDASIQEIVVTGSRIRRVDDETASPVQVVDRKDIERTGATNIADVIRSVIQADNQGSIPTAATGGFAAGSAGISLRGLGVNSTLVLVNGRRMASYGLADDGVRTFVDLNSIPFDAVERIEVLKDGGSAIYGSDAVAGVVNIILRDKFDGLTISGETGVTSRGDGDTYRLSAMGGTSSERFSGYVAVEALKEEAIAQGDRGGYLGTSDLRSIGFFDNRQGARAAGFGNFSPGVPAFSGVTPYGSVRVPGGQPQDRTNLLPCPEVSADTGVCVFDTIDYIQIAPEVERFNVLARGSLQFSDTLEGYAELGYFTSHVTSVGTPGGVNDNGVFDPANPASPIVHTTVLPAGHPDNPTGVARTLSLLTTMLGGRNGEQETEVFRGIVGLTGEIGSDWEWDAGVGYIDNRLTDTSTGYLRHPVLQAALNSGEFRINPALNSQALLDRISPTLVREPSSSVAMADGRVSGSLLDLRGGRLGVAVGAEWRSEKIDTPPTPYTDTGELVGLGYSAYSKDRKVYAAYTEVDAPVTSWLGLNAALRFDHYDDYGSSTTPKLGVTLKPFSQLLVRGTYQEAFRAPGPAESGDSASFGFTNIGILTTGNPDLKPEEAKAYTFGLVYEPFQGTSLSVDYYRIDRDNEIVSADQAVVVGDLPVNGVPDSRIPGLVPNSFLFYDEFGDLATIAAPFVNANTTNTDGFDLDLRHRFEMGRAGTLTAALVWTHVLSFERQVPGSDALEYAGTHGPYVLSAAGGTPADRGRLQLTWDYGDLSLTGAVSYVSSMDMIDHEGETLVDVEDGTYTTTTGEGYYVVADPAGKVCGVYNPDGSVPNNCKVDSFTSVDLRGSYTYAEAWEFNASIKNLLDTKAPFDPYTYGGLNYNPVFHQQGAIGRSFSVGLKYSFQ